VERGRVGCEGFVKVCRYSFIVVFVRLEGA
jgi:hypothetical protein